MEHYRTLDNIQLENTCVTIGSFDGVHLGHQEIVRRLVHKAKEIGSPSAVITFFPHPASVLGKNSGAFYLMTDYERAGFLEKLDLDLTITLPFTKALSQLSAADFIQQIVDHLHPQHLIVGYDFSLGRNRQGNIEILQALGDEHGFDVEVVPPVTLEGEKVSSSRVRKALEDHQIELAARLLGRWYSVSGSVTFGDRRGGKLGIPTANLEYPPDRLIPPKGVYATWAKFNGQRIPAVTNIGVHPTFDNGLVVPKIEAHLLDFSGDLYANQLTLDFVHFIRPEKKFDSVAALLAQIDQDIQTGREVLGNAA